MSLAADSRSVAVRVVTTGRPLASSVVQTTRTGAAVDTCRSAGSNSAGEAVSPYETGRQLGVSASGREIAVEPAKASILAWGSEIAAAPAKAPITSAPMAYRRSGIRVSSYAAAALAPNSRNFFFIRA